MKKKWLLLLRKPGPKWGWRGSSLLMAADSFPWSLGDLGFWLTYSSLKKPYYYEIIFNSQKDPDALH